MITNHVDFAVIAPFFRDLGPDHGAGRVAVVQLRIRHAVLTESTPVVAAPQERVTIGR